MAAFQTARVFGDNMVLQRSKPLNIFGTGGDGTKITVSISGENPAKTSAVVKNGRWIAVLPPQKRQENVELTITDGVDTKVFYNIAIGEVWLAGGQSNMELELQTCNSGEESLANDITPDVRFYYTMKKTVGEEDFFECERQMGWNDFSNKESARHWSAIGYYFAKELSERLGVVVGIIGCNWGGTSASAWLKREYADGETAVYFEDYDKAAAGKTEEQLKRDYRDYQEYHAAWEKKSVEYYTTAENPTWDGCLEYCGENKYPGPASPINPMSPGVLHESMVQRIAPFTLTGVLWYQGESDDHRPDMYHKLLPQLLRCWRDDWNDDGLFFVIGQLPMHRWEADPDFKHWCKIREAQAQVCRTVKNTSLAVLIDCGEFSEIHPKDKITPAHRFLLSALHDYYKIGEIDGISTASPEISECIWTENGVRIIYNSDCKITSDGEISGFELLDNNGEWRAASAVLSEGEIVVSGVENPFGVRYLWTNYTEDIPLRNSGNDVPFPPFIRLIAEYGG